MLIKTFRRWIEWIRQYRIESKIDPEWLAAFYTANREMIEGKPSESDEPDEDEPDEDDQ